MVSWPDVCHWRSRLDGIRRRSLSIIPRIVSLEGTTSYGISQEVWRQFCLRGEFTHAPLEWRPGRGGAILYIIRYSPAVPLELVGPACILGLVVLISLRSRV